MGAGPSLRHRQVLLLEQTYQHDHLGQRVSRLSGLWRSWNEGMCGSGTRSLVSLHINSLRLLGDGLRVRGLASPHPFLGATRCAVRIVLRLWTSLLFCSSISCIPTRTWRCLSFRSSECSNFQLCFRGVYAQCKLCKSWSFHRAVLRRCLRALCCALTGAGDGPDSAENREDSACVLGHGSCPSLLQ